SLPRDLNQIGVQFQAAHLPRQEAGLTWSVAAFKSRCISPVNRKARVRENFSIRRDYCCCSAVTGGARIVKFPQNKCWATTHSCLRQPVPSRSIPADKRVCTAIRREIQD